MINTLLQLSGNALPENPDNVFPVFKLGWIDARTFREPLRGKTRFPLVCYAKLSL
jgi:hypothetical protein